jgi:hypothetical protein
VCKIRLLVGHLACCTRSPGPNIACHGCIEGISTYDVVHMSRRSCAWLDDGIETLNGQFGTWETKASLSKADEREGADDRLHLDYSLDLAASLLTVEGCTLVNFCLIGIR